MTRKRLMRVLVRRVRASKRDKRLLQGGRSLLTRLGIDPREHDAFDALARLAVELSLRHLGEFPEFAIHAKQFDGKRTAAFRDWLEDTAILGEMDRAEGVAHRDDVLAEMKHAGLGRAVFNLMEKSDLTLKGAVSAVLASRHTTEPSVEALCAEIEKEMEHASLRRAVLSMMEKSDLTLEGAARAVLSEWRLNEPSVEALCAEIEKKMKARTAPSQTEAAKVAKAVRAVHENLIAEDWYKRESAASLRVRFFQRKYGRDGETGHGGNPPLPGVLREMMLRDNTLIIRQLRRKDGSPATNPDGTPLVAVVGVEIGGPSEEYLARVADALKKLLRR